MRVRRGISVIEILFSIGIVGIGLLGVLALVPLAMRQVGQGNEADRSSRMGQNALAEFEIRGMGSMENWRSFSAGTFFQVFPPLAQHTSFAVDPLAMSLPANQTLAGSVFPAGGAISMPRFTLRSGPPPMPSFMSSLQADRLFILRDELLFNVERDPLIPPAPVFNWDQGPDGQWGIAGVDDDANGAVDDGTEAGAPGSDDQVTTRQSEGLYSWFATMTPKLDSRSYPENFASEYILSAVICRNRDFDVTNGSSERVVDVVQIYGDGTRGGDMLIRTLSTSSSPKEDLEGIRPGSWVMLSCLLPSYPAGTNFNYFAWYRVESVDDESILNGAAFELDISLSGPDWPLSMTVKPGGPGTTGTQMVIVKNLISVYQKAIRLESSSLWSQ